jgi:hypothetical protein
MEQPNDLLKARTEAALLLRLDPSNLSPADTLNVDLVCALRRVVDAASESVLESGSTDLGRLIVAVETLIKLLPGEPPKPASSRHDPRQIMWENYLAARRRGDVPPEGWHQRRLNELESEVERLKAELAALKAGAPAPGASSGAPVGGNNVVKLHDNPGRHAAPAAPPKPEPPPAAASAPAYDYDKQSDWKNWVNEDGSIRTTPFGGGKYWGDV